MATTTKPRKKRVSRAEMDRVRRKIRRYEIKRLREQLKREDEESKKKRQGQTAAFLRELRRKNGLGEFSSAAKRRSGRVSTAAAVRSGSCKRGPYKGYTKKPPTAPGISGGC